MFLAAAALLSLERICYVWVWRFPEAFRKLCERPVLVARGGPVHVLQKMFYCFKGIQLSVFAGWFLSYGSFSPLGGSIFSRAAGGALIIVGQILNLSVFYRLGPVGVFYGNRFGHRIPWCQRFPFSLLKHPQYVGAMCSVWGLFLAVCFPRYDWFVLPSLETVYYVLGACLEQ